MSENDYLPAHYFLKYFYYYHKNIYFEYLFYHHFLFFFLHYFFQLYYKYCADFPFKGRNEKELYKAIKRSDYYIIDYVPNNVKKVIKGLIEYDPNKRLTCKEILKSEWLKN